MKNKKGLIFDIILIVFSALFVFGSGFLFTSCGPKEDGSYMVCHWAWIAVVSIAAVLLIQSLLRLFFTSSDAKKAMSAVMLPLSLLAAVLPDNLIKLCMMNNMHCHTVMRPFAMVMGIVIALTAACDIIAESVFNKNKV